MDKIQGKASPDELPDSSTKVSKLLNIFSYLPSSSFRIEILNHSNITSKVLSILWGGEKMDSKNQPCIILYVPLKTVLAITAAHQYSSPPSKHMVKVHVTAVSELGVGMWLTLAIRLKGTVSSRSFKYWCVITYLFSVRMMVSLGLQMRTNGGIEFPAVPLGTCTMNKKPIFIIISHRNVGV